MCIAPPGSGKTLAFLLPLLNFLITMPPIIREKAHLGPYAMILGPTRELVQQIKTVFDKLSISLNIRSQAFIGGYDKVDQNLEFLEGFEVLFATVGRCKDLLDKNMISLS